MKQLDKDPWDVVAEQYPIGAKVKGKVTNITDYGAFVELEDGIEGLVHVSEMSWTKKNVHPGKILSTSEEVEVQVLEIDAPSAAFRWASSRPRTIRGKPSRRSIPTAPSSKARSRTSPNSACSSASTAMSTAWSISPTSTGSVPGEEAIKDFKKGDIVKAMVLDVDREKERISLGIKQLGGDQPSRLAAPASRRATP